MPPGSQTAIRASLLDDGTCLVTVEGELDLATAPQLEDAVLPHASRVVVDLTRCTFLDAASLRAITKIEERAMRSGASTAVAVSDPALRQLFEIAGLDLRLHVLPSLAAALARARPPSADAGRAS